MKNELEVPFLFEDEKLLIEVENVYSVEECEAFIEKIKNSNPDLATNNALYRNQDRIILDSEILTKDLEKRLKKFIPQKMGKLEFSHVNERLRMYRYQIGQKFPTHTDHWHRPNEDQISLYSVLVYFNQDFIGGETEFTGKIKRLIKPKAGNVIMFQHKLDHAGLEVIEGVKYAMRTDLIYKRV